MSLYNPTELPHVPGWTVMPESAKKAGLVAKRRLGSGLCLTVRQDRGRWDSYDGAVVGASHIVADDTSGTMAHAMCDAERIAVDVLASDLAALIAGDSVDEGARRAVSLFTILNPALQREAAEMAGFGDAVNHFVAGMSDDELADLNGRIAEEQRRRRQHATVVAASAEFDQVEGKTP